MKGGIMTSGERELSNHRKPSFCLRLQLYRSFNIRFNPSKARFHTVNRTQQRETFSLTLSVQARNCKIQSKNPFLIRSRACVFIIVILISFNLYISLSLSLALCADFFSFPEVKMRKRENERRRKERERELSHSSSPGVPDAETRTTSERDSHNQRVGGEAWMASESKIR
jgi:hypothetical protein